MIRIPRSVIGKVIAGVLVIGMGALLVWGAGVPARVARNESEIRRNGERSAALESRMADDRKRQSEEIADLRGSIRDLSARMAQGDGEIRAILMEVLKEVKK